MSISNLIPGLKGTGSRRAVDKIAELRDENRKLLTRQMAADDYFALLIQDRDEVYVAWEDFHKDQILFTRSLDCGQTFDMERGIASIVPVPEPLPPISAEEQFRAAQTDPRTPGGPGASTQHAPLMPAAVTKPVPTPPNTFAAAAVRPRRRLRRIGCMGAGG